MIVTFFNRIALLTIALAMSRVLTLHAEEAPTITVSKGDRIGITIAGLGGTEGTRRDKDAANRSR